MAIVLCALIGTSACANKLDPAKLAGDWLAPAEDADDVDAIISLSTENGVWRGQIKAIKPTRPDQKLLDNTPCHACSGPRHDQMLKGLEVIWGAARIRWHAAVWSDIGPQRWRRLQLRDPHVFRWKAP